MEGRPYTAGGIKTTVAGHPRREQRGSCGANLDRLVARGAALRHDDRRDEVRLRPHRPRRAPQPRGRARAHDERTFLGAHVVPPEHDRRRLRRARQGRDARRLRAARDLDRRLLRGRRLRRRADPRDPAGGHRQGPHAARARQPAQARPGHPDRGRARAPPPPTTAPTPPTTTSTRWPTRDTVATLLPGAEFSTRAQYPDARRLIDAGVTVALAADCNPGSSYTTNIPFCIAIAVREMRMTPDEAVAAATLGGAKALRRTDIGHLGPGAQRRRGPARRAQPHPPRLPPGRAARRHRVAGRGLELRPVLGLGSRAGQADDILAGRAHERRVITEAVRCAPRPSSPCTASPASARPGCCSPADLARAVRLRVTDALDDCGRVVEPTVRARRPLGRPRTGSRAAAPAPARRRAHRVRLPPLPAARCTALESAARRGAADRPPARAAERRGGRPRTRRRLHRLSGGNPFYLTELAGHARGVPPRSWLPCRRRSPP